MVCEFVDVLDIRYRFIFGILFLNNFIFGLYRY